VTALPEFLLANLMCCQEICSSTLIGNDTHGALPMALMGGSCDCCNLNSTGLGGIMETINRSRSL
jgi:hypothetical protein